MSAGIGVLPASSVVFIGGLALGSWLCARRARMGNPLLYARLVGRLMWYAGQKTEVYEEQPEAN
jgi:hypothetical protein